LRSAAWTAHAGQDLIRAEQLYRQLLSEAPDPQDAINLGALLRTQGRLREAGEHYRHWLTHFPDSVTLRLNGVNSLRDAGAHDSCERWLREGLQQHPQEPRLLHSLAKTLLAQQRRPEARALLSELSQRQPEHLGLLLDLGLCCHGLGEREAALAVFEQARARHGDDPRPAANAITLLKELGRPAEAETLFENLPAAVRQSEDVQAAWADLLLNTARLEEAATVFDALSRRHPQSPLHWLNLAASLRGLKNMVACTRALKQGLARHPGHRDLEHALGQSLAEMGRQGPAMELLRRSLEHSEPLPDSHLFNLQFLGAGYGLLSSEERQTLARQWEARKRQQGVGPLWGDVLRSPLGQRPLRVGYLSADFCNHPVGRFVLPLLRAHNRQSVEVWGLSCGPHDDAVQQQIRQSCDHWLDLRFGTDLEAARQIADAQLDVLIELGGFTCNSRLALLAHRPAPIQLSYLGFYAPTYLEAIDGWIGDAALFASLNPIDRRAHRLVEVPGGYMAFVPEALPPLQAPEPGRRFRYGSFNHARKLTPETIALWCALLAAVPEADLALKSISFVEPAEQQRIRKVFEQQGLEPHRLVLLNWVEGWTNHMACYREIDVALDPMPYGGATTSCEALAMGVPVISLAGAGMVGCLSASVLTYGAAGQGLAHDLDSYVAQAIKLQQAEARNLAARSELRQEVCSSGLCDAKRLGRELESLYRAVAEATPHS